MSSGNERNDFNKDRAELFEALGHPTRIRILQCLAESPLGFAELKKRLDIESGGLLQFHLGKLQELVKVSAERNYALTDEGKEALRSIVANAYVGNNHLARRVSRKETKILMAALVLTVLISAGFAWQVYLVTNLNQLSASAENVRFVGVRIIDVTLYQNASADRGDLAFRWVMFCNNPNDVRLTAEIHNINIDMPLMDNRSIVLGLSQFPYISQASVMPHSKDLMSGTLFFNTTLADAIRINDYLSNGTIISNIALFVTFRNDCPFVSLQKNFDSARADIHLYGEPLVLEG